MRVGRALAVGAAIAAGTFGLPYVVPSHASILSASYLAGFNNSFAYLWWVLGLAVGGAWLAPLVSGARVREALASAEPLFVPPPAIVWVTMAAHAVLFGALYYKAHGFTFGEPLYFEDAAYRALTGRTVFVDFYFFYGPLMVTPTAWLARIVGLFPAYGVYYVATYLAGLYCLYVVLVALAGRRAVTPWFLLFAIGFFNPITGLNYTFVRFMLPLLTLLAAWRAYRALSVGRWVAGLLCFAVALLYSPDTAIVSVASVGVLGVTLLWCDGPLWWRRPAGAALVAMPLTAMLLAAAALFVIDGTWHPLAAYLRPVVTFNAGGWSTPIDPSPPMLTLLGVTLRTMSLLWRSGRETGRTTATAMSVALGMLVLLTQRACLGKSDIQHIAFSGLPAFMLAAAWMPSTAWAGRAQMRLAAWLLVGVVASLQFYHAMLFLPSLMQKRTPVTATAAPAPRAMSKAEIQASLDRAVQTLGTDRPYYMHRLEYYRLPIYTKYRLLPIEYQSTLASAFTPLDIEDHMRLLRRTRAIVLVSKADLAVRSPVTPLPTSWWFSLASAALPCSQIFNWTREFQTRLEAPLVRMLNTDYDRVFEDGDIVGLALRMP